MGTTIQKYKQALNLLPLSAESLTPLNDFISIFDIDDDITPKLSYTSDASMTQFSYTSTASQILPPLIQYFINCDIPQQELQNLERICRQINPDKLGFFIRQEEKFSSIGWTIPQSDTLSAAENRLPPGHVRTQLKEWTNRHNLQEFIEYSRIVGPGSQWEEITITLPNIEIGLDFFDTMQVVKPAEPLLEEMKTSNLTKIGLTIWVDARGNLIRLAFRAVGPTIRLTLASRLVISSLSDFTHAIIEGIVEATKPNWVEIGQVLSGMDSILCYEPKLESQN